MATSCVMKTGGFIDEMVAALCSHANDGSTVVRRQITESLVDLGRKQPNLVISSCLDFLRRNQKCEEKHRIILLQIMERILSLRRELVNDNLAAPMIELCMSDMTREKEVMAEWQGAASAVLVSAGMRWPNLVMDQLMARFSPGTLPHYFVVKTLGDFAAANPIAAVPQMKVILARVLPVLGSIKQDNMKWVVATSMWKFCDAVVTYVADISQAPDKSITVQGYSGEIFPAYEIIFTNWLPSKEPKVRAATIQAVGSMCAIITPQQFETQLPRVLAAMLALYKKDANHLPITMGLCQLLDVAIRDESQMLYPHLNNLLSALHALACVPPEAEPMSIKNHNELMRCFDIMGRRFPDDVITFLLGRLDIRISKTTKQRTATLLILKHLVTRLGPQLEDRRGLVVSGIQPIARTETSLEVKKTLAQLIIAMAGHNYLAEEGGHVAIEFIVAQCALTDVETKIDRVQAAKKAKAAPGPEHQEEEDSPEELRNMCDNVLNLLTTTIPCMVDVLWPFLLEMLVPQQNTPAIAILAKCVAHLAALKRSTQAADYLIDFDRQVNLPKPPELIARLMVMLSVPLRRGRLGLHILQALLALGPALHPNIAPMWDHAVPKLAHYLQTNSESPDTWNANAWDELVLRLLAETIKVVDSEDWTLQLGDCFAKHLAVYASDSELKRSCFKQLGLVLQKLTKKDYIHTKLQDMFAICQHGNENERQGCAQAFGYCAASHLDIVLQKVNSFLSGPEKKESSGGFLSGLLGGGSKPQESAAKGSVDTCFLAFGYIAAYATPSLITTRIDVHILNNIKLHLPAVKTPERKTVAIKALDLIGKAMHPTHLGTAFVLRQRDELLGILLEYVAPTPNAKSSSPRKDEFAVPHAVRIAGLNAIATYTFLEPAIPDKLQSDLATRTLAFLELSSVPPKDEKDAKSKEKAAAEERAKKRAEEYEKGLQGVLQALNESLAATLFMDTSIAALTRIFNVLRVYSCKADGTVRERTVNAVLFLLKKYVEYKTAQTGPKKEKHFEGLGACLAFIIPRCTDPVVTVRQRALEAVGIALYIDNMLRTTEEEADGYNMVPPSVLRPLNGMREQIASTEMNDQYRVMQELAGILGHMVTEAELPLLLKSLLAGLTDAQLPSALGTCVVLNGLIKNRGEELKERVPEVLGLLIEEMKKISVDQTLNATLHAVRNLALHHRLAVMNELLAVPVPHPPQVVKSFQVLAKDSSLVMDLVNHLLQLLNYGLLYDEKGQGKEKKYTAKPLVLSATAALGEIMQTDEMAAVVEEHYALLFGSLLLRLGTSQGQPDALRVIADALRSFIDCAHEEETLGERMKQHKHGEAGGSKSGGADAWARLEDSTKYTDVVTEMTGAVGAAHPEHVGPLYRFLLPFMKGNYPGHRAVAACALAELVNHTAGNGELLHQLVNALLLSLADTSIKLYALRGLGNIVSAGKPAVDKYATTVLDALVSYIDSADEVLAMESMNGLSKVFELVDESRVAPTLINLCHRIRPAFEKAGDEMRAASFTLFGTLARFGQDELAVDPFFEQIHMNLPAVVLHINDGSDEVQEACKKALRRFGPLLRAEPLHAFLDEHLAPGAYFAFDDFLTDFARLLIDHYPERMNYYVMTAIEHFQSNWTPIRGSAASLVGALLGQLPPHKRSTLNVGLITQALVALLKQKEADVRRRAASAIGLLHDY